MNKQKKRFSSDVNIQNRKAKYEFILSDDLEAGIVLTGSEIKSIREGKVSLQEAYCLIENDEIFIKGMTIAEYQESGYAGHEPTRKRKLLLSKREIAKYKSKTAEKGLTIIPTKLYLNKRGFAKLRIALAKGKKLHDKRHSLREKDDKRQLDQLRSV
jgi:SsrA-binding protein